MEIIKSKWMNFINFLFAIPIAISIISILIFVLVISPLHYYNNGIGDMFGYPMLIICYSAPYFGWVAIIPISTFFIGIIKEKKTLLKILLGIFFIIYLLIFISALWNLITGIHLTQAEKEEANKYLLEYVYFAAPLQLKDEPYTRTININAKYSSNKTRFTLELHYLNINQKLFTEEESVSNLNNSLVGFSYKIYDKTNSKLIYFNEITEADRGYNFGSWETAIYLNSGDTQLIKGVNYEIILYIPGRKDTLEQYLNPIFVVGFLKEPSL